MAIFVSFWCSFGQLECFGGASFRPNLRYTFYLSAICLSVIWLSALCLFGWKSFGLMSDRENVFRPYVLSVVRLSAICPFGHLSFGHLPCYRSLSYKVLPTFAHPVSLMTSKYNCHIIIFFCINLTLKLQVYTKYKQFLM